MRYLIPAALALAVPSFACMQLKQVDPKAEPISVTEKAPHLGELFVESHEKGNGKAATPASHQDKPASHQDKSAVRPYLGVQYEMGKAGVVISGVLPGTGAEEAGLKKGDVLLRVGGVNTKTGDDLVNAVKALSVGEQVAVKIRRGKDNKTLLVPIGAHPESAVSKAGSALKAREGKPAPKRGRLVEFRSEEGKPEVAEVVELHSSGKEGKVRMGILSGKGGEQRAGAVVWDLEEEVKLEHGAKPKDGHTKGKEKSVRWRIAGEPEIELDVEVHPEPSTGQFFTESKDAKGLFVYQNDGLKQEDPSGTKNGKVLVKRFRSGPGGEFELETEDEFAIDVDSDEITELVQRALEESRTAREGLDKWKSQAVAKEVQRLKLHGHHDIEIHGEHGEPITVWLADQEGEQDSQVEALEIHMKEMMRRAKETDNAPKALQELVREHRFGDLALKGDGGVWKVKTMGPKGMVERQYEVRFDGAQGKRKQSWAWSTEKPADAKGVCSACGCDCQSKAKSKAQAKAQFTFDRAAQSADKKVRVRSERRAKRESRTGRTRLRSKQSDTLKALTEMQKELKVLNKKLNALKKELGQAGG